ncbi:membrane-bound lytic murein transglycosylase D [Spirosomataceae bacterium TFI 002]|nr:membrane-bound lytic murein transglycosylase D [Spirosomataceae bacterium TFI 002]
MDLRAFKKLDTTYSAYIYVFLIAILVPSVSSFGTSMHPIKKATSEVRFADVVFQFNDATKQIFEQEVAILERSEEAKQQNLSYLSTYLPEVEPLLRDAAIPDDYKYLVIYNKYQKSISRSSLLELGVFWCMDELKATDVNLTMNKYIDERKHLYAASEGAMVCLRRNQVLYNNWGSTLFAHLADRSVLDVLEVRKRWNENKYILLDSPAYASVIQFLAYKKVMEQNLQSYKPVEQMIVYKYPYGANKAFNIIAADLRVEPTELIKTNEWLKVSIVPNIDLPVLVVVPALRYYDIRQLAELSRKVENSQIDLGFPILVEDAKLAKGNGGIFYRINTKKGIQADLCDNFVTLAYQAKIKPKKFLKFNEMDNKDITKVGRVYYLEQKNKKGQVDVHVVREGESIWDISQMYALKTKSILKYNRLKTVQRLPAGRVLNLRQKKGKKDPIEYIEIEDAKSPTDYILTDPIFSERSTFEQEEREPLVEKEKFVPKVIPKPEVKTEQVVQSPKYKIEDTSKSKIEKSVVEEAEEKVFYVKEENLTVAELPIVAESNNKPFTQQLQESAEEESEVDYVMHKVKKGETLYRISVNYKVSLAELYKLNKLSTNVVEAGDEIRVKRR